MKGRPGDYWHQALDRLPLPDRLARIRAAGFAGLVLDRAALPDAGLAYDQALAALGAVDRIESRDGTLVVLPLARTRRDRRTLGAAALGGGPRILSGGG